jgi:hypothetical protein
VGRTGVMEDFEVQVFHEASSEDYTGGGRVFHVLPIRNEPVFNCVVFVGFLFDDIESDAARTVWICTHVDLQDVTKQDFDYRENKHKGLTLIIDKIVCVFWW